MNTDKTREARLRRAAHKQGLHIAKLRRFEPGYGWYLVVDDSSNAVVSRTWTT
ncbi:hypothetical protein [Streptomyces coeruleorubidus]|uniref:hypothetical protein n=1 Tax=Streptomyces coeruleorubidus TaxID=116188 RepID=UPI0037AD2BB5